MKPNGQVHSETSLTTSIWHIIYGKLGKSNENLSYLRRNFMRMLMKDGLLSSKVLTLSSEPTWKVRNWIINFLPPVQSCTTIWKQSWGNYHVFQPLLDLGLLWWFLTTLKVNLIGIPPLLNISRSYQFLVVLKAELYNSLQNVLKHCGVKYLLFTELNEVSNES